MFNRFTKNARRSVEEATEIARDRGALSVEAEHLLLAISRSSASAGRALQDAELDHDSLASALDREAARSLAAVGVIAGRPSFSPFIERPRFGASAKQALERALGVAVGRRDNRIDSGHIALAVLRAPLGTVPRALDCAEIDRVELASKIERAL